MSLRSLLEPKRKLSGAAAGGTGRDARREEATAGRGEDEE
jgi:hypothetical protein